MLAHTWEYVSERSASDGSCSVTFRCPECDFTVRIRRPSALQLKDRRAIPKWDELIIGRFIPAAIVDCDLARVASVMEG